METKVQDEDTVQNLYRLKDMGVTWFNHLKHGLLNRILHSE